MKTTMGKEVKVGLMSIVSIVLLYTGVRFLKGSDYFSSTETYYVILNTVDGLTVSNPVLVNGLAVGRVDAITLLPRKGNPLLVTIDINNDVVVGDSTQILLSANGLLGGKQLELDLGRNTKIYKGNDTLIANYKLSITDQLTQVASPVLRRLDTTAINLNLVLKDFSVSSKKLNDALGSFKETSQTANGLIEANSAGIGSITTNLSKLSASAVETERNFKQLLAKMNRLGDTLNKAQLAQTVANANKTLENMNAIVNKINKGQGTMGKLVTNDSLYRNLNKSSEALNKLLVDLKEKPKRYVHFSLFGSKTK